MKVDLFITCLNDALFPRTGIATTMLLERLGCEVRFNPRQTCCGQMHLNSGYMAQSMPIVRHFVDTFKDSEAVVSPSGSCVGMIRVMAQRAAEWSDDDKLSAELASLSPRVYELSEFLTQVLEVEEVGAYLPYKAAFHPTCHSLRLLKVGDAPMRLLQNVEGLCLVEQEEAQACCGFGGTFSVKNADTSTAMLQDKLQSLLKCGAEVCIAGDNSCLMHIGGGSNRLGLGLKTLHLAEVLASTREHSFA